MSYATDKCFVRSVHSFDKELVYSTNPGGRKTVKLVDGTARHHLVSKDRKYRTPNPNRPKDSTVDGPEVSRMWYKM